MTKQPIPYTKPSNDSVTWWFVNKEFTYLLTTRIFFHITSIGIWNIHITPQNKEGCTVGFVSAYLQLFHPARGRGINWFSGHAEMINEGLQIIKRYTCHVGKIIQYSGIPRSSNSEELIWEQSKAEILKNCTKDDDQFFWKSGKIGYRTMRLTSSCRC